MTARRGVGGQNAKSLREHVVDGTFQQSRHGHLLTLPGPEPPAVAKVTDELRIECRRARGELSAWRKRAKDKPGDLRIARVVLLCSRHYSSLLMEIRRRVASARPAPPKLDPFLAHQQKRYGGDDDNAA